MKYRLQYQASNQKHIITLNGSKSISNRALIIRALCDDGHFEIDNLSTAKDTTTLLSLLDTIADGDMLDAGAAGTTFRFLTAYLALQDGAQILTGSERMKHRPIGDLVSALRQLGAEIDYLKVEGFPPLKIHSLKPSQVNEITLPANISSQFISALMLIAPALPTGLTIHLQGDIVSLPYLVMTKELMTYFGAQVDFDGTSFSIPARPYKAKSLEVEGDWSAASYYYSIVAFEKIGYQINLKGLHQESVQGDQVIADIAERFGVDTIYEKDGITIKKTKEIKKQNFDYDFILCPDLAQTVSIMMAGLGVEGRLTGLKTLRIKETDRIFALQKELSKVGVTVDDLQQNDIIVQRGQIKMKNIILFDTYEDHRMAMTLTTLGIFGDIEIHHPDVVKKSYPNFWNDLERIGFKIINRN